MTFQWPTEGASVILLPHGDMGERVFSLAEEWTQHRLLVPAIYIRVENQLEEAYRPFEETGPVKISALVSGRNGHCEVSLFEELSRNEIKLIKVLACRLVDAENSFHNLQDRMVDRLREQIERSAPLREESGQQKIGTEILRLNLIAGESTKVGGSTAHLLELEWDANIILSPEDRSTPSGFDTFIDSAEIHYPGFLLSNMASTAGLWTGVNKSVLELNHIESSSAYDKVLVQRTFGRVVKTDSLAIRLASGALKQIQEEGNPLVDPTYHLAEKKKFEKNEIPTLIEKLVEESLKADDYALSFNLSLEKEKAEGIKKMSLLEGIKLFVKFFFEKLIALPRHLLEVALETFNKKATKILFGEDSGYAIQARKDIRKYGLGQQDAEDLFKLDDVKKLVSTMLDGLPVNPDYRSQHPNLWLSIRKMMVGSLEGSLSDSLNEFSDKVLVETERLIPKFGKVWTVPECAIDPDEDPGEVKATLEWLDVEAANKISQMIEANVDYLKAEIEVNRNELLVAENERDATKKNTKDIRRQHEKLTAREKSLTLILEGVSNDN